MYTENCIDTVIIYWSCLVSITVKLATVILAMLLLYTCNIVSLDTYHAPYLKSHSFYYCHGLVELRTLSSHYI